MWIRDIRIDNYEGIVTKISKDKTNVTLTLPGGGEIIARNEGFNLGESICFIKNTTNKIIKLLPKNVARAICIIEEDKTMKHAIIDKPTTKEIVVEYLDDNINENIEEDIPDDLDGLFPYTEEEDIPDDLDDFFPYTEKEQEDEENKSELYFNDLNSDA